MRVGWFFKTAGLILLILVTVTGIAVVTAGVLLPWQAGLAAAMGGVRIPWQPAAEENRPAPPKAVALGVELVKGQPNTLFVPEDVREPWESAKTTPI
jgi:hypothetical protein